MTTPPWILIPARNEAPRLGSVLARVAAALPAGRVLVVNSHSTDATARVAWDAGADEINAEGRGYAAAIQEGHRALVARGASPVLQLDADGQHPPEALPELLAALDGADWVFASRAGTPSGGLLRSRLAGGVLGLVVRGLTGLPLGDVTSGMWAVGPRAARLLAEADLGGVADANVRVLGARAGLRLVERPVTMALRPGGASMHDGLRGVWNLGRSVISAVRLSDLGRPLSD